MPHRRESRKIALQLLYQFDMQGSVDIPSAKLMLEGGEFALDVAEEGLALALAAWETRLAADATSTRLAPHWPTSRQPPVDRAIIRLGYYEIASAHAPGPVVVDEAVELAKIYCAQQSPAFINAILDKVLKAQPPKAPAPEIKVKLEIDPDRPKARKNDAWLDDAISATPEPEYHEPDDHDHLD
jgi:N utilization substance protein B